MLQHRVIPCLLLYNDGLVKTTKFKDHKYVGDPINAVKIFNDKEVDELIFLDITASKNRKPPSFEIILKITTECFMPFCYGGGITSVKEASKILNQGAEKISLNSSAIYNSELIYELACEFGNQSIVVSVDIKKSIFGTYQVYDHCKKKSVKISPVEFAKKVEGLGAGELLINSVDKDGTMDGFDINLIKLVTDAVNIPVIACGGAGKMEHLKEAVRLGGASAVAAGSMFVFQGKHKAVLINYPSYNKIKSMFS